MNVKQYTKEEQASMLIDYNIVTNYNELSKGDHVRYYTENDTFNRGGFLVYLCIKDMYMILTYDMKKNDEWYKTKEGKKPSFSVKLIDGIKIYHKKYNTNVKQESDSIKELFAEILTIKNTISILKLDVDSLKNDNINLSKKYKLLKKKYKLINNKK